MDALTELVKLNAAYAKAIDDDRLEAWPDFFTDRCHYAITSTENHALGRRAGLIYADSRGMLRDRVASLRNVNIYEKQSYRHIVGLPDVTDPAATPLASETPFLVVRIMRDGHMSLFATGRYVDKIVFEHGVPKLAERVVVCDSSRIDTLLAIPL
jgi:3-phenylpropionate/cinnamic acid dioxygenase small subunit